MTEQKANIKKRIGKFGLNFKNPKHHENNFEIITHSIIMDSRSNFYEIY